MILVDIVRFSFLGVMLFCIPISMDLECLFLTALPIVVVSIFDFCLFDRQEMVSDLVLISISSFKSLGLFLYV